MRWQRQRENENWWSNGRTEERKKKRERMWNIQIDAFKKKNYCVIHCRFPFHWQTTEIEHIQSKIVPNFTDSMDWISLNLGDKQSGCCRWCSCLQAICFFVVVAAVQQKSTAVWHIEKSSYFSNSFMIFLFEFGVLCSFYFADGLWISWKWNVQFAMQLLPFDIHNDLHSFAEWDFTYSPFLSPLTRCVCLSVGLSGF